MRSPAKPCPYPQKFPGILGKPVPPILSRNFIIFSVGECPQKMDVESNYGDGIYIMVVTREKTRA